MFRAGLALVGVTIGANAQARPAREWNSPASLELAGRATERRSAQLADTGLTDYRALAHGYVTFLGQFGEGFPDPPQVVRADELAVEVYWRAPNRSKQHVVGRRAELVRPTDITYHADHLAIVQNNFPAIIRLGDGDEVRDVPHPLSATGNEAYDFAIADSLTIRVAGRSWDVIAVEFRPRDSRQPRAVGTAYIDRESASVVRLSVAFTRAALIDPALEDVSIVLDNGLVDGRFWLPRRQEIEIRRTGTWLEFPARGIIRGEWDLCCVAVNTDVPAATFSGPEISFASPSALAAYQFPGSLADSIAARAVGAGPDRVARIVQDRAAELVRDEALRRAARVRVSAASLSDFARVNRVEGLAVGAGATIPLGTTLSARARVRYGIDDRMLKFRVAAAWSASRQLTVSVAGFDEFRAVADAPESSILGNSIAAQEFGADVTDDFRTIGFAAALEGGDGVRWRASVERTRESPLSVHARPFSGEYRPAFAADRLMASTVRVDISGRRHDGPMRAQIDWRVAGAATAFDPTAAPSAFVAGVVRLVAEVDVRRELPVGTLQLWLLGAGTSGGRVPVQSAVLLGGPLSGPGYVAHSLRGQGGGSLRVEWQVPVGRFPLDLGRFGATKVGVSAAPFLAVARVGPGSDAGWRRSIGMGIISGYDLFRIDVARGVDRGGEWVVRADFSRKLWPIL